MLSRSLGFSVFFLLFAMVSGLAHAEEPDTVAMSLASRRPAERKEAQEKILAGLQDGFPNHQTLWLSALAKYWTDEHGIDPMLPLIEQIGKMKVEWPEIEQLRAQVLAKAMLSERVQMRIAAAYALTQIAEATNDKAHLEAIAVGLREGWKESPTKAGRAAQLFPAMTLPPSPIRDAVAVAQRELCQFRGVKKR